MALALQIHDETMTGESVNIIDIVVPSETLTVRELIEQRVRQEVDKYNESKPGIFRGLVEPSDAEKTLNGFKLRKARRIDPDKQCEKAVESFQTNGFFILVDDRQVESLDEEITLRPDTQIGFVKLVPLVGG